jgi:hypothetical protein
MWAVIGVWKIDPSVIEELRAQVPLMASSKVGTPGFLHGTWTLDGHMMQVFADERNARRYHGRCWPRARWNGPAWNASSGTSRRSALNRPHPSRADAWSG